jgi:hypothetical protein
MPVQYEPWSVQNEKLDQWGFRILEGKFNGTLIGITSLELEDNSNELKLDFDFVEKTSGIEDKEYSSKEFNTIMENIINDILFKAMDEYKNRNGDTAESS